LPAFDWSLFASFANALQGAFPLFSYLTHILTVTCHICENQYPISKDIVVEGLLAADFLLVSHSFCTGHWCQLVLISPPNSYEFDLFSIPTF
jgi:hypothetical protein